MAPKFFARLLSMLAVVVGFSAACAGRDAARQAAAGSVKPPTVTDARQLLPPQLLMVVHIDFAALRRSPHFASVEGLLRRSVSKAARDNEATQALLRRAERVWIAVQAPPANQASSLLQGVDIWHGPLTDADLRTILLGMAAPQAAGAPEVAVRNATYRGVQGWQAADVMALQPKPGLWVTGQRAAVQASIERLGQPGKPLRCLGCGSSQVLDELSLRMQLDQGPLGLALDLTRLPGEGRSKLLGSMLARVTSPTQSIGIRAQLTEALKLDLLAGTTDAVAARDWQRTVQGFVSQMQGHPLVGMLGFAPLLQQIEVRQDGTYVEAKLALDEASTREFLQKSANL